MRRPPTVPIAILLIFAALLLFFRLDQPNVYVFDESHYVPAAKLYLQGRSETNYEHPPLGKELIAAGIFLFGDNPWGWRAFSALFGLFTLVAVYTLAQTLFENESAALFSTGLVVLNQIWFVQSRMGTLDVFMVFFLFVGFQSAAKILFEDGKSLLPFLVAGLSFGLATSCKWFAAIPFGLGLCWLTLVQLRRARLAPILAMGVTSLVAYGVTCIPFLLISEPGHTLKGLVQLHWAAIDWQSHGDRTQHHFSHSEWYTWPFASKAMIMYYLVNQVSTQFSKIILLLLSPVQTVLGGLGLGYAFWRTCRAGDLRALFLLFTFASLFLPWSVIPHFNTYYYYYYPASLVLALGAGYLFAKLQGSYRLWFGRTSLILSALCFGLAYPLLAAVQLGELPFWRSLLDRFIFLP